MSALLEKVNGQPFMEEAYVTDETFVPDWGETGSEEERASARTPRSDPHSSSLPLALYSRELPDYPSRGTLHD